MEDKSVERLTFARLQLESMAAQNAIDIAAMATPVISPGIIHNIVKLALCGEELKDEKSAEELKDEHEVELTSIVNDLGDAYETAFRTCHYGELYLIYIKIKLSNEKAWKAAHVLDRISENEVFDLDYTPKHFGCITVEYFTKFDKLVKTMLELSKLSDEMIDRLIPSSD